MRTYIHTRIPCDSLAPSPETSSPVPTKHYIASKSQKIEERPIWTTYNLLIDVFVAQSLRNVWSVRAARTVVAPKAVTHLSTTQKNPF